MSARTTRRGFIDAFVDGLDLAALGFVGTVPKVTGRPGYAPAGLQLSATASAVLVEAG